MPPGPASPREGARTTRQNCGVGARATCSAMRNRMKLAIGIAIGVVAMLAASAASAHHSHAMFDSEKQVTLTGVVKEFQWNNPHCWIQLLVQDPGDSNAAPVEWAVELGAPIQLLRHGWKPGSLKPGDRITVVVNPLRDGRTGGQLVSATGPDGKPIGTAPETYK